MIEPIITIEDLEAAYTARQVAYATYYQASRSGCNYREALTKWRHARDYCQDLQARFEIQQIGKEPCIYPIT